MQTHMHNMLLFSECRAGFYGQNCTEPCISGDYGRQCKHKCNCSTDQSCDRIYGCVCRAGFTGTNCDTGKMCNNSKIPLH